MMRFTDKEKQMAAEREAAFRRSVYPRWVDAKRMSQKIADQGIAIMDEIAADYRALVEKGRLL